MFIYYLKELFLNINTKVPFVVGLHLKMHIRKVTASYFSDSSKGTIVSVFHIDTNSFKIVDN